MKEGLVKVCNDSRGNQLWVEDNEVGGRRYWSDDIGGGVCIYDTSLASREMLLLALKHEHRSQLDLRIQPMVEDGTQADLRRGAYGVREHRQFEAQSDAGRLVDLSGYQ
jgi:hypothetical protein